MIVCITCGAHNGDEEKWCAACGEYLEFYGVKTGPEPASDDPVAPAERPGLLRRLMAALGFGHEQ